MKRTVTRASRLRGDVRVPGELGPAVRALWLAGVAEGTSRIDHVPATAAGALAVLQGLGVGLHVADGSVRVEGRGLRGLQAPAQIVDLPAPAVAALPALAILALQPFACRVRVAEGAREPAAQLLSLLARGGSVGTESDRGIFELEAAQQPAGVDFEELDLPASVKLGLLVAGLYADGPTIVREPPASRDRVDAVLKERGAILSASREGDGQIRAMTLVPDTGLKATDVDIAGSLDCALPLVAAALFVRRADVRVQRVMVRPKNRTFLDVVRQIGADVEIVDGADGSNDLLVKGSRLKGTRVAGKRAQSLLDHVALVAVLATQADGEFVLRDIESLRQGEYDFVDHLADLLRRVDAKVGEFPEGIVVKGGRPLQGGQIDSRRHPGVVQAFAVAGLIAHGDMEIEDTECVDGSFPGFFDTLDTLQAAKAKESAP